MTWAPDISAPGIRPPGEWDILQLADQPTPGIATVTVTMPDDLDVQKAKGSKRATVKDNGDGLVEVRIELELLPSEWEPFAFGLLPVLRPRSKSGGRDPVSIYHPTTFAAGVDRVIIRPITIDHPDSGGTLKVTISAIEWAPEAAPVKTKDKVSAANDAEQKQKEEEANRNNPTNQSTLDAAIAGL